jgi:membrane AbrB-like protein
MLFIVIFGVVGGGLAKKMGLPGGAVVGAMLGAGLTAVVLPGRFILPDAAATAIQIMLGISLGMTFDRSFLALCGQVLPMAILSTIALLSVAVLMAYIAQRLGLVDFATALFGFSPGGMSGMSLLAQTEGYNTAVVAFLHVVRIFTLFLLVPVLGRLFLVWAKGS